uniref:Uncharacterized protein n=1 Tax=Trichobilharzia regenti TaxID=157069 RepID=A0AA85J8F9_TRIRE|nr:unnamed protein product [Trichobilharzia regenti]
MIILQSNEKKYSLRNEAENQLIFATSHGNRFSLPKLEHIISEDVDEEDSISREVTSSEAVGGETTSSTVTVSPQGISGEYELAYLAKNEDGNERKFWLLQESNTHLGFSWIPFSPSGIKDLELQLYISLLSKTSIILSVDTTSASLNAIGEACTDSAYYVSGRTGKWLSPTLGEHRLNYKRVPRIKNVQLQSGKLRNVTWEQESAFCKRDDVTVIFSGQENQPLEMIILQSNEKKYSLRNEAENQLIFATSHGNRFSLPKLEHIISEDVDEEDSISREVTSSEAVGGETTSSTVTVSPQGISGEYELAYLAKNEDGNERKFWLLQESNTHLGFSWIPFSPSGIKDLELQLYISLLSKTSIILSVDTTSASLNAIGEACTDSAYYVSGRTGKWLSPTLGEHRLNYKRVPRIKNVQLQSGKLRNVTWEQESAFCKRDDVTVIFSGQENQPLEMIILQSNEKKYSLRNEAENQLIFATSHGNRFSLPKLEHIISEDVDEEDSISRDPFYFGKHLYLYFDKCFLDNLSESCIIFKEDISILLILRVLFVQCHMPDKNA